MMHTNKPAETHSFDVPIAIALGSVEKAIIVKEIFGWCRINEKKDHNIHFGFAWTYNPARAYALHFPYLSKTPKNWENQLKKDPNKAHPAQKKADRLIRELEEAGFLYAHKFNTSRGDHTKSHTVNWPLYSHILSTGEYSEELATDFIELLNELCSNLSNRLPKNEQSRLPKNEQSYTPPSSTPSSSPSCKSENLPEDKFEKIEGLKKKIGPKHYEHLNAICQDAEIYSLLKGMYKDGRFNALMDWLEYKKEMRQTFKRASSVTSIAKDISKYTPREVSKGVDDSKAAEYMKLVIRRMPDPKPSASAGNNIFSQLKAKRA